MPTWISVLYRVGTVLLELVPATRRIAGVIVAAVEAAERQPDIRGPEKKEYALRAVAAGVAAVNAAAGHQVIDPDAALRMADGLIDLLVGTVNEWHAAATSPDATTLDPIS